MLTAIFVLIVIVLAIQLFSGVASGIYLYKSHQRMQREEQEHERRMAAMYPGSAGFPPTPVRIVRKEN